MYSDDNFLPELPNEDVLADLGLQSPLDCPRYDIFNQFRFTPLGAIGGLIMPVETPCVDQIDFYHSKSGQSVSLEYLSAPARGYLQLQIRLHHHHKGEERGKVDLVATHSWFSDEKQQFNELIQRIRSAVVSGYSPLWELVRYEVVPDRFAQVLQEEMPGGDEIYFKHLQFEPTKVAIQMEMLTVEQCMAPMGVRPSAYVRVTPKRFQGMPRPVSFIRGVRR